MAECSKGTNSSHGEYSHKYNENQYHSTTPCTPTLSIRPPPSQTETDAPSAHSALLSSHPPGEHLRAGRKVTSTGRRVEQYWSPISTSTGRNAKHYWLLVPPCMSSLPHSQAKPYRWLYLRALYPHDGSQQTRVGKCLAPRQAPPKRRGLPWRSKTKGLALSKIIHTFAEQKGQLRPPKPQAGL